MDTVRLTPPSALRLDVQPPGDKSIGHRSLILNAAATGEATVTRFPRGADTLASLAIVRALGVRVIAFLLIFLVIAYMLKREIWRDVH